jgi:hypothetical protein
MKESLRKCILPVGGQLSTGQDEIRRESEPKPCGLYVEQWILPLDRIAGLLSKHSLVRRRPPEPTPCGSRL